jgi:KaiC/GvpD/RAD55 family RecA-like ATPase
MPELPARGGAPYHAVQFYSNENCLYSTVATFVGEGFLAGEPALLIATEPHAKGIVEALTTRFIDVAAASRLGELTVLDAAATLSALTRHGDPDREQVEQQVAVLIERMRAGRKRARVRIYGEMVDLLWKAGRADAALNLERMWNELASRYAFSLLCGYSVGNFYKQATQFPDICAEHTHVLGADSQPSRVEPRRSMTPD